VRPLSHLRSGVAVLPLLPTLALGLGMLPFAGGDSFAVAQAPHMRMSDVHAVNVPLVGPTVVRPGKLPRGPRAGVLWLVDNVVHTGTGRTVKMPWTRIGARKHSLRLVGRTDGGWLVKSFDGGDSWTLWSIRDGKRHLVTSSSVSEGEVVDYRLSQNHRRFLIHRFDGDRSTSISVRTLQNTPLDTQEFDGVGDVLAFSGPEVVVGLTDTQRWNVAARNVEALGVGAAGADLEHDLLFVTDPESGESGPTSLESPASPAWTATMAQTVVSPGGGRVLSRDERGGDRLTVRNRATGAVRVSFAVRFLTSETPVWESNRSFVFIAFVGGLGDRETLVRCRLSGVCQRISPIAPRDTISLPPV
jgi:hypothetical protein